MLNTQLQYSASNLAGVTSVRGHMTETRQNWESEHTVNVNGVWLQQERNPRIQLKLVMQT